MATKLQETVNGMGGNIEPIREKIREAAKRVLELQAERDVVTAEINECRASVKALGIEKKAFDFAVKRKQMDEDKRDKLDANYSVACDALGVPLAMEQGILELTPTESKENANEKNTNIGEQQADAYLEAHGTQQ